MTCVTCKTGITELGTTVMALERGPTVLVVRHVPANVCTTCGEAYLNADAVDRLQDLLDRAARDQVQVEIREYAA